MRRIMMLLIAAALFGADVVEAQRHGERPGRGEMRDRAARHRLAPVPSVGVRGTYDFDAHIFGIGGQAELPLSRVLRFVPSGEVHLGDERGWQANADVAISLLLLRAGGGLALVDDPRTGSLDDDPELGLNLFAGIQAPPRRGARLRPFAEARWTHLENHTPFRLVAGINVPLRSARRR
jgi:hypothetical protein